MNNQERASSSPKIGELLLRAGKISTNVLNEALERQKKTNERLGQILISMGVISPSELAEFLEAQSSIPYIDINSYEISGDIVSILPEDFIKRSRILPIRKVDDIIEVGCVPPINPEDIEKVRLITGLKVSPYLVADNDFLQVLDRVFNVKDRAKKVISALTTGGREQEVIMSIPDSVALDNSVVSIVNSIISDAINQDASDVHLNPQANSCEVRYRIDGIMYDSLTIPRDIADSLISLLKVTAGMDIAERRRPQDGHFDANYKNEIFDFRVSSMGTSYGEKLSLRILSKKRMLMPNEQLGMLPEQYKTFVTLISRPYGIIFVTGPTGSGKTTTLYSVITSLATGLTEIVTIEDPVEYNIPNIVQIQINEEAGITFASGLRSVLRLDPNIIMVGEVRDLETAKVAIEASLTGHLVLASLHTNDVASTPLRLINLGVEPYLLSSTLIGAISQRLVRVICPNCKASYSPSKEEKELIKRELGEDVVELKKGEGCPACNFTGYRGRTGIFEIMEVDRNLRTLIEQGAYYDKIKEQAINSGMVTMRKAGIRKVVQGITTLSEIERAVED